MTAKRYHKLCRAEMTKLMAHKKGAALCIRTMATISPFGPHSTVHSYQEMWTALCPVFTYANNTPSKR